jgi:heme/copper-type cytochrome/quinol oxidase subunit 2
MRPARWIPLAIYLDGLITTWIGWMSPWIDVDELAYRIWRQRQDVSIVAGFAWLGTMLLALGLIAWMVYWIVLALKRREHIPGSEFPALAIVSAVVSIIGLACTAYLTYVTYGYADGWADKTVLESSDAPLRRATVTKAPWLTMAGYASLIVGGVWLWRMARDHRRAGLAELQRRIDGR